MPAARESRDEDTVSEKSYVEEEEEKHPRSADTFPHLVSKLYTLGKKFIDATYIDHMKDCKTRSHEKQFGRALAQKGIVKEDAAQFGYGEMTEGSVKQFINILTTPNRIERKGVNTANHLLNKDSVFLDIGSGAGKVVMQVALSVGCKSIGVEVLESRVNIANNLKEEFARVNGLPESWF